MDETAEADIPRGDEAPFILLRRPAIVIGVLMGAGILYDLLPALLLQSSFAKFRTIALLGERRDELVPRLDKLYPRASGFNNPTYELQKRQSHLVLWACDVHGLLGFTGSCPFAPFIEPQVMLYFDDGLYGNPVRLIDVKLL